MLIFYLSMIHSLQKWSFGTQPQRERIPYECGGKEWSCASTAKKHQILLGNHPKPEGRLGIDS